MVCRLQRFLETVVCGQRTSPTSLPAGSAERFHNLEACHPGKLLLFITGYSTCTLSLDSPNTCNVHPMKSEVKHRCRDGASTQLPTGSCALRKPIPPDTSPSPPHSSSRPTRSETVERLEKQFNDSWPKRRRRIRWKIWEEDQEVALKNPVTTEEIPCSRAEGEDTMEGEGKGNWHEEEKEEDTGE
eukprot:423814-Hanusia_phi.AAC.3